MTREMNTRCPWCGHLHGAVSAVTAIADRVSPEPKAADGDLTMCIHCGNMCVFERAATGGLRHPTAAETAELDADSRIIEMRKAWLQVKLTNAVRQ
jgi:hypothetical protein